jgi:ADP-L-glycero-D-manno-heptose 6-epimerase
MPDVIRNQYQYYTCAEISKIRRAGYDKETISLENAVKDYIKNYLQKNLYISGF